MSVVSPVPTQNSGAYTGRTNITNISGVTSLGSPPPAVTALAQSSFQILATAKIVQCNRCGKNSPLVNFCGQCGHALAGAGKYNVLLSNEGPDAKLKENEKRAALVLQFKKFFGVKPPEVQITTPSAPTLPVSEDGLPVIRLIGYKSGRGRLAPPHSGRAKDSWKARSAMRNAMRGATKMVEAPKPQVATSLKRKAVTQDGADVSDMGPPAALVQKKKFKRKVSFKDEKTPRQRVEELAALAGIDDGGESSPFTMGDSAAPSDALAIRAEVAEGERLLEGLLGASAVPGPGLFEEDLREITGI